MIRTSIAKVILVLVFINNYIPVSLEKIFPAKSTLNLAQSPQSDMPSGLF